MDGTNTAVSAKAVRMLFALGFHISEQIKEQMEVQGSLLRSLFYSQFVIKSIYITAVERIFRKTFDCIVDGQGNPEAF